MRTLIHYYSLLDYILEALAKQRAALDNWHTQQRIESFKMPFFLLYESCADVLYSTQLFSFQPFHILASPFRNTRQQDIIMYKEVVQSKMQCSVVLLYCSWLYYTVWQCGAQSGDYYINLLLEVQLQKAMIHSNFIMCSHIRNFVSRIILKIKIRIQYK